MKENFIILKDVLSEEQLELIVNYMRLKAKANPIIRKDLLKGTHREYGDFLMESLFTTLTPKIEAALKLSLWPTLSFYYYYENGAKLPKHKDRSSCEIVAGICFGFDEESDGWPLILDCEGKSQAINLNPGDLVIFSGYQTEHWRETFQGKWFISGIWGFVDRNGPFAFQKYDQRKSLGLPHVGMFNWTFGCWKAAIKKKFG